MTLIAQARALASRIWLARLFAREFGFSDLLSNYSRAYAWMANQLGHMTLALATTALFVMLADTLATIARAAQAETATMLLGGVVATTLAILGVFTLVEKGSEKKNARPAAADGAEALWIAGSLLGALLALAVLAPGPLNAALLGVSAVVIALTAGIVFWRACAKLGEKLRSERHGGFWSGDATMICVIVGVAVTLAVAAAAPLSGAVAAGQPHGRALAHELELALWAAPVGLLFVAVILLLAKDCWIAALGCVGVLGAVHIASDGFFLDLALAPAAEPFAERADWSFRRTGGLALAVLFAAVAAAGALGRTPPSGARHPYWMAVTALLGGAWFVLATWRGLEAGWAAPVAGAMSSLALWWVKEFGSDLPNVAAEIGQACEARRRQGAAAAPPKLLAAYRSDGEWDCRTDSLFYFAGAWIGAGLLSETPSLTQADDVGAWRSGAEIIGLLLFIAIFLLLGRNWAYRQEAIDMTGAPRANRLALLTSRLTLAIQRDEGGWNCNADALATLAAFAQALPLEDAPFDHLLVVGGPGEGKSALGHALATEAALVGLPAWAAPPAAMLGLKRYPPRKLSRVVTAEHLASISERYDAARSYQVRDLQANPVVTLYASRSAVGDPQLRTLDRRKREVGDEPFEGARIVVVTDTRRSMAAADLDKMFRGLDPSDGKQTVWLIENGPELTARDACEATLDCALMKFITDSLRPALGGDRRRSRFAIAHVASDPHSGQPGARPSGAQKETTDGDRQSG